MNEDYKQAAEYWQRMYEEAFVERTCRAIQEYGDGTDTIETCFECSECGRSLWEGTPRDGRPVYVNYCQYCGAKVVDE